MSEETVWLYINQMMKRGKNYYTGLMHFIVRDMHWELNFRGDSPLLQYHTNGRMHVLQIDGDLFYPIEVQRRASKYEDEKFDGYLMPMKEVLKFINIMLYEDMELEYNDGSEPGEHDGDGNDYEIYYEGDNDEGFEKILEKVEKYEQILEEDVLGL